MDRGDKKIMANDSEFMLDESVRSAIDGLVGQECCRQRIGRGRSLAIGFGNKVKHGKPRLVDDFYGEWEIGSYMAAWRIIQADELLCGSNDVVQSLDELDKRLSKIRLGKVAEIVWFSKFDIRVQLEEQIRIEFLWVSSEDDEMFHIFCPNNLYVKYSIRDGWETESGEKGS